MKILPTTGNELGFSQKSWNKIEASISHKSQVEVDQNDAYVDSLKALQIKSSKISKVGTETLSEFVRSPSSPYGGKEVINGYKFSGDVDIVLEGNVTLPESLINNPKIKEDIAKDFVDIWGEINTCYSVVEEMTSQLKDYGEGEVHIEPFAEVVELSKNPDGTYRIVINFNAECSNEDSASNIRTRKDSERVERKL
jgi:hypothetical protein